MSHINSVSIGQDLEDICRNTL